MIDIQLLRDSPDVVAAGLRKRGQQGQLDELIAHDAKRRSLLTEAGALKKRRNESSREIGRIMKEGGDASALRIEMKGVGERVAALEEEIAEVDGALQDLLRRLPNLPHASVPEGRSAEDNPELRRWGTPRAFDFQPQAHWDLGPALGILDFERAARMTGARFALLS